MTAPQIRPALAAALAAIVAVLAVLGLAGAAPAAAHAALLGGDPAADTGVEVVPAAVTATFNEDVQPLFAAMTVIGPDGEPYGAGEVRVDGPRVSIDVQSGGPAGTYTVNYRVTSVDGHPVSGSWSFDVATASPPAPETVEPVASVPATADPVATEPAPSAQPAAPSTSWPVWTLLIGVVAAVGAAVWWAAARR